MTLCWRELLERAGPRLGVPTTDDPDLHLLVDGRRVDAASRSGIPQELRVARDPRCLGIRQVTVTRGKRVRVMEAEDERLAIGFHAFEAGNGFRWTGGDAEMPEQLLAGVGGPLEITLRLGGSATYVNEGPQRHVAQADGFCRCPAPWHRARYRIELFRYSNYRTVCLKVAGEFNVELHDGGIFRIVARMGSAAVLNFVQPARSLAAFMQMTLGKEAFH